MKKFCVLLTLVFLASCGEAVIEEKTSDSSATGSIEVSVEGSESQDDLEGSEEENEDEDESVESTQDESEEASDDLAESEISEEDESKTQSSTDTAAVASGSIETSVVADDINAEIAVLEEAEEDTTKTVTLDASYNNPKGPVDMTINYSLNEQGEILEIGVAATTYDVSDFNASIQTLVGSTLEEAAEYNSSSSLTGDAFTTAIKAQL